MQSEIKRRRWVKAIWLTCCGGMVLQVTGCGVDPDLLFQAGLQFATELAIFATDNVLVNIR